MINKKYILYAFFLIVSFFVLKFLFRNALLVVIAIFAINVIYNKYIK